MQAAVKLFRTYTIPQPWLMFTRLTITLLVGYVAFGVVFSGLLDPYLKGLTTFQHFLIHYSVGIFFGYIIAIAYRVLQKKEADLPFILCLALIWSHLPDLVFLVHQGQHPTWMVVFFFHTMVDNTFLTFPIFLALDTALIYFYPKLAQR